MKKYLIVTLLFVGFLSSCDSKSKKKSRQENAIELVEKEQYLTSSQSQLLIEGEGIWVRDKPFTGKVVMKLNTGDVCKILDKGEEVQLNKQLDRWYEIEFKGQHGWVFASQTNLKSGKSIEVEDFSSFLKRFIPLYRQQNLEEFIHKDLGSQVVYNPGVFPVLEMLKGRGKFTHAPHITFSAIYNKTPKGHFCDGYPNVKDGFYYWKSSVKELPYYADISDENNPKSKQILVPDKYTHNQVYKVQVISESYHNCFLFFINIGKSWYLVAEDYVDCSA